jgi:DNA-directed RNA polymerase specialized sigma subunit
MPALEARILRLSFEKQKTIKEIATLLGISHEKVKQLRQKATRRMKNLRME